MKIIDILSISIKIIWYLVEENVLLKETELVSFLP
jgi:hypothetical protein